MERWRQMAGFKRILFPVDFSERCRAAAPFVKMMVQRCNAELTVLHVIELPVSVYTTIGYETMLDLPLVRRAAREHVEAFARAELEGAPVRTVVNEGRPAARIVEYSHNVDLIMI